MEDNRKYVENRIKILKENKFINGQIDEDNMITNNIQNKSNNYIIDSSIINVKVKELTIQLREYFYFKLKSSLWNNFKVCRRQIKCLLEENVNNIAGHVEYNIFCNSKLIFEYKHMITGLILGFEKCTREYKLCDLLRSEDKKILHTANAIKENINYSIATELPLSFELNTCFPIKLKIKNSDSTMKTKENTTNPLKLFNILENNLTENSSCVNNNLIQSDAINNDMIDSYNVDNRGRVNNIKVKNKKTEISVNNILKNEEYCKIKMSESVGQHYHYNIKNFEAIDKYSNGINYQYQANKVLLQNLKFNGIGRLTFNILKPIIQKYYLSVYIPNAFDYKYIFQRIHGDILHKKIYDENGIREHAEKLILSKKYLYPKCKLTICNLKP